MKVSVLVPVFGVESYIAKCANTLMEQTYKDVEYIFVNDCTTDASIERLQEVVDNYPERKRQVKIVNHEKNLGLAMARQTALDAAVGDAVIMVDSDDYVDTMMIECLVNEMLKSNADIVDGGFGIVNSGTVDKLCPPLHRNEKSYLRTILCQNVEPNRIWGRLIRKSLFNDNGIRYHCGVDYSEDFSVLPLLLVNAKRSWVDKCIYYYRDDNILSYTNNISTKNAISFFKAQNIVGTYFLNHTKWSEYSIAAQLGWVNVWRFARRFNVDASILNEYFKLWPFCFVIRVLAAMMKSQNVPFKMADFLYLSARRFYLSLYASKS